MIEIVIAGFVILLFTWCCLPLFFAFVDATDLLSRTASRLMFDLLRALRELRNDELDQARQRSDLVTRRAGGKLATEAGRTGLWLGKKHGELSVLERFDRMEDERARARLELRRQREQLKNGGAK